MANDNQLQIDIVISPEKAKAQMVSAMGEITRTAESIFAASEARKVTHTSNTVRQTKQVNGEYQDWWKRSLLEQDQFEKMLRQAQLEDNRRMLQQQVSDAKAAQQQIAAAHATTPQGRLEGLLGGLGVKTPQQNAQGIKDVKDALTLLEEQGIKSGVVVDQLNTKLRLFETGNARGRGEIHKLTAALASLAFEVTGAVYGVTALASIIAAPAFFGTAMLKRIEDAQTGVTGILISMGTLEGKALTFGQAWQASSQYVKAVQADSMKYGIDMGRLMEVNQAAMSGGLNAMMNLEQIQKVATAGAIAVSSLGLNSQQYVQEVRDLISGGIQPASSTLARSIGVTDALLKQWKAEGPDKVVKELTDRLQGFMVVADQVRSSTLTGAWDILQARLAMLLSDEQGFGAIKKAVIDVANWIGKVDVSGKFILNADAVNIAQAYWEILKSIGSALGMVGELLGFVSPLFGKLGQFITILELEVQILFKTLAAAFKQVWALSTLDFKSVANIGSKWSTDTEKLTLKLSDAARGFLGLESAANKATSATDETWKAITGGVAAKSFEELDKMYDRDVAKKAEHDQKLLILNQQVWAEQLKQGAIYYEAMEQLAALAEAKRKGAGPYAPTTGLGTQTVSGGIKGAGEIMSADAKAVAAAAMADLEGITRKYDKWVKDLDKQTKQRAEPTVIQDMLKNLEALNAAESEHLTNVEKVTLAWEKRTAAEKTLNEAKAVGYALLAAETADITVQNNAFIKITESVAQQNNEYDIILGKQEKLTAAEKVRLDLLKKVDDSNKLDATSKELLKKQIEELYGKGGTVDKLLEWNKIRDQMATSITAGIMQGFEKGASFPKIFAQMVKDMFKQMVLEPQIKASVTAGVDWVANLLGLTTATSLQTNSNMVLVAALNANTAAITGKSTSDATSGASSSGSYWGLIIAVVIALVAKWLDMAAVKFEKTVYQIQATQDGITGSRRFDWTGGQAPTYGALGTPMTNTLNTVAQETVATFGALGDAIGVADVRTKDYKVSISTSGDVVAELTNGIGAALIPALRTMQREGETLADTAKRITGEFKATSDFIVALGVSQDKAFGGFGLGGAAGREALIAASGGLQAFTQNAQSFVQNFLTPAQQLQPALDNVGRTFARLNITGVTTNKQFADLVKQQMELGNTDVVAQLLSVADSFNSITKSAGEANAQLKALLKEDMFRTLVDFKRATMYAEQGNYYGRAGKSTAGADIAAATIAAAAIVAQEAAGTAGVAGTFVAPGQPDMSLEQSGFASIWEMVQDLFTKFLSKLWEGFKDLLPKIVEGFKDAASKTLEAFKELPGKLLDMFKSVFSSLPGSTGGGATGFLESLPNPPGFANGGVFGLNGVRAFANGGAFTNGIFNTPTPFMFANGGGFSLGVMGEAGNEAVMPLHRGADGALGVLANMGASADLITEIRALRAELMAANVAIAQNTGATAKQLLRWEGDGLPETRVVTA